MRILLIISFCFFTVVDLFAGYPPDQLHYWRTVMPIMRKYCNQACHNADDNKGGLNLNRFDFILTIQREGEVFANVINHVDNGTMPPEGKPQLSPAEKDTLLFYLKKYLHDALAAPDPGIIPAHRMSNREYKYAIQDLTGIDIPVETLFPRDPGGGEGFDNYALTLYISPIQMERYFEVAEQIGEEMRCNMDIWRKYVPEFKFSWSQKIGYWWASLWNKKDIANDIRDQYASQAIQNFATMAYRRYLSQTELQHLLAFYKEIYAYGPESKYKFEEAIQEVFKAILVSPQFLMRQEADPDNEQPYRISNFELASRLSFFLWSSIPDRELLETAYRKNLHDPKVLEHQVERMLKDPKAFRMAESFATQWLEIEKLNDPTHEVDKNIFPDYNDTLKQAMLDEAVHYFYHVLTDSRNFLELLNGQYTFLNEPLAKHYGIEGIKGDEMRKFVLNQPERGGIMGMAGVLTATSLPNRTSPVLRGKWVMEKILYTPAKPPPPNVPELEASKNANDEMSLRELLVLHRDNIACRGCHEEMDDLGFALENFDAIGRWRKSYQPGLPEIDVSGVLKSGKTFEGPVELKRILTDNKEAFAKGLSKKMLGFALGRSIEYKDTKVIQDLSKTLLDNNFDPLPFIKAVANSYPFQYKKSDPVVVDTAFGD